MSEHCDVLHKAYRSKLNGGFAWVDVLGTIDADILLRHILRGALVKGWAPTTARP
jgi:hypothetical protein